MKVLSTEKRSFLHLLGTLALVSFVMPPQTLGKPQYIAPDNVQVFDSGVAPAAGGFDPAAMMAADPAAYGAPREGEMAMMGMGDQQMPLNADGLPPPGQSRCQTVCEFQKPVVTPEEVQVALAQPPKYEQVMVSPPKIHYCPGQVALKEVQQPPVIAKCIQNKLEYVPMRAEFESQPVDPSILNAPVEHPCGGQYGAAGYGAPVKTSALD